MKFLKLAFIALVVLLNVMVAQPSWADSGKFIKSPDYAEVTQALTTLLKTPKDSGLKPEEIAQKVADLRLQKYILETAESPAQCHNQTGKTLAIYAKSKKAPATQASTLYYLGSGKTTDDDWACDGVYLPTGSKVAFAPTDTQGQDLTEAIALKIVPGTQLIASANPDTGAVEFNVPAVQFFKAGEGNWSIPNLSLADLESQTPNAPVD